MAGSSANLGRSRLSHIWELPNEAPLRDGVRGSPPMNLKTFNRVDGLPCPVAIEITVIGTLSVCHWYDREGFIPTFLDSYPWQFSC
jgi:hypothetical protein